MACRLHCGGRCAVGSGGKSVGYLAHGTATDYMYDTAGVPMSFTWEIFGDLSAEFADCFRMFNPITAAAVEATVSNWALAVLSLVELLPQHPDIAAMNLNAVSSVPATASNKTALATSRLAAESAEHPEKQSQESNAADSSASEVGLKPDKAVHGGRTDDVLAGLGEFKKSPFENDDLEGGLHENTWGGHLLHATERPSMLSGLYVLPVIILLLLAILFKRARTDRSSWLRMRQRTVQSSYI